MEFAVTRQQLIEGMRPMLEGMARAADRLLACRVLGLPYPAPDSERERVAATAAAIVTYDAHHTPYHPRRWTTDGHDPGDEDRG